MSLLVITPLQYTGVMEWSNNKQYMTKISKRKIQPQQFAQYVNNLWAAFTLLGSKQQIRLLFKDLLTPTEYTMLTKRLEIARRLLYGDDYETIKREVSVTNDTISNLSKILANQGDGLRLAHKQLSNLENKLKKQNKVQQRNLENPWLKKINRKTLLGTALKAGVIMLDEKISESLKKSSAKKQLEN